MVVTLEVEQLRARVLSASIPAPGRRDKFLAGPPLRQLMGLVDRHGVDAVSAALERAEPGVHSPVRLVELLAGLVLTADDDASPSDRPATDPQLARRNLERQIATYQAEGAEPPDGLLSELARWQDGDTREEAMA